MQKKQLTIQIEGMSCGHCSGTVERTIRGVEGVNHTEVSLSEKTAKVEYDGSVTSREDIVEAVMETPFQVVGVS